MGNEALCRIDYDGASHEARALLETEEVIIRGALRLRLPFREAREIEAADGVLRLRWPEHELRIHLGKDAAKWAEKIRNPKSVMAKLGIKAGQKVSVLGAIEHLEELEATSGDVSPRLRKGSDVIFFAAASRAELGRLAALREALRPDGALWVIRPKGVPEITEADVMAAGKAAGLVDVKVVKFSETHTAEKFVIPLARR
ncbi:MAG TPA: hypothetical protein VGR02_01260 [Thermoanaerobaculia bacterium]|jgi:hypothetical protein|nr:hypothetical protein [Thermoanaerobaculia bacterium]